VLPVNATCISVAYGPRVISNLPAAGTYHNGVDLPVSIGSPVYATAAGHLLRV
jgi:murein DD-endopeptidase MepM/ murein hydrolase activator NlpD